MLGVNESDNRIKCLQNLLLACLWIVCLCASETGGRGNQLLELHPPLAVIARNSSGCVSEVRNFILVELDERARRVMPVCRFGAQLVHEGTKLAHPVTATALSLAAQRELVSSKSAGQRSDDAGRDKPRNLKVWVEVAQAMLEGIVGGPIGALIYMRLLTPNL